MGTFSLNILLYAIACVLIVVGLAGAIVPVLPGIPLIFGGICLIAGTDRYQHVGPGWLLGIAAVGAVGLALDLLAGALGAKRVGASTRAVCGAHRGDDGRAAVWTTGFAAGAFRRSRYGRARGRQEHSAFGTRGRERLDRSALRDHHQIGFFLDDGGALRRRLVVEPWSLI